MKVFKPYATPTFYVETFIYLGRDIFYVERDCMERTKMLQIRKQKGYEIANKKHIEEQNGVWIVPSQTNQNKKYQVTLRLDRSTCTCEDFVGRGLRCKHIFAVEITVSKKYHKNGTVTETVTKRVTYSQDWHNYTLAQNQEGKLFRELLKDLTENVEELIRIGAGRPRVPLKEALFCAIEKVYSMQSSRRAYSLYLEDAKKQQISKAPNYNVINILLNDMEVRPILYRLLQITAMPLKSVETQFTIDSTGFRTTQFSQYCKEKHNTKRVHNWIKAHLCVGIKTNIVTDVEITNENGADSPQFIHLTEGTRSLGFNMQEVSADKAYSARANLDAVAENGGITYIPFKINASQHSHGGKVWNKMFYYYQMCRDEFMEHYHKRSNVETTNMAIKMKFGDCLKNKNFVSQSNELLCKLIAYNITVLINSMYELGIKPELLR